VTCSSSALDEHAACVRTAAPDVAPGFPGRNDATARISLKWGKGYERPTDKWGMGVCSGRRPSGRRWGMGVCRPGNTPVRGGYGSYEAIQPDFAPDNGRQAAKFSTPAVGFPVSTPPLYLGSGQDPPPLCALRAATSETTPVVSRSRYLERKHFHRYHDITMRDMGTRCYASKWSGYNVSYVRYMQVWSLRGMGVCSGRRAEASMWGIRVCC